MATSTPIDRPRISGKYAVNRGDTNDQILFLVWLEEERSYIPLKTNEFRHVIYKKIMLPKFYAFFTAFCCQVAPNCFAIAKCGTEILGLAFDAD